MERITELVTAIEALPEHLSAWSVLGAVIIIAVVVSLVVQDWRLKKNEQKFYD